MRTHPRATDTQEDAQFVLVDAQGEADGILTRDELDLLVYATLVAADMAATPYTGSPFQQPLDIVRAALDARFYPYGNAGDRYPLSAMMAASVTYDPYSAMIALADAPRA